MVRGNVTGEAGALRRGAPAGTEVSAGKVFTSGPGAVRTPDPVLRIRPTPVTAVRQQPLRQPQGRLLALGRTVAAGAIAHVLRGQQPHALK